MAKFKSHHFFCCCQSIAIIFYLFGNWHCLAIPHIVYKLILHCNPPNWQAPSCVPKSERIKSPQICGWFLGFGWHYNVITPNATLCAAKCMRIIANNALSFIGVKSAHCTGHSGAEEAQWVKALRLKVGQTVGLSVCLPVE